MDLLILLYLVQNLPQLCIDPLQHFFFWGVGLEETGTSIASMWQRICPSLFQYDYKITITKRQVPSEPKSHYELEAAKQDKVAKWRETVGDKKRERKPTLVLSYFP